MASSDRLQKVLARAGIASRRHAEELITGGRVRVNGRVVTELGTRADPRRDKIEVDGKRIVTEPLVYYMFHKPRSTVTTLDDPEGRATIAEYLKDLPARVFPVGRLDFHTSGALLLTNDGDLAQALLHPRRSVPKTYVAKVRGVPTDLQIEPMRTGVELEPVPGEDPARVRTRPADVEVLRHAPAGLGARSDDGTTWLKITLREGRNRQIHRMAEAVGLFVMRLARIAFAGITTESLRPGELRALTEKEVTALRATYLRPVENAAAGAADKGAAERASVEEARGERGPRAGARGPRASERGPSAGGRGPRAGERASRGDERGPRGTERGARNGPPAREGNAPRGRTGADAARGRESGARGGGGESTWGPAPRGPRPERTGAGRPERGGTRVERGTGGAHVERGGGGPARRGRGAPEPERVGDEPRRHAPGRGRDASGPGRGPPRGPAAPPSRGAPPVRSRRDGGGAERSAGGERAGAAPRRGPRRR